MRRPFLTLVYFVAFVFKNLRVYQIHTNRHLIPSTTFECASCSFLLHATPLLEEKWDFGSQALIPNIRDPFLQDWPRPWTRLAAHDHPIDIFKIQFPKRTNQRLKRQEFDFCACFPQVINPEFVFFVLHTCADPDVISP